MNNLIKDLIAQITVPNSESILQLALILERSTFTISNDNAYILNLPPQLLDIILTLDEQNEIVDAISQRISSGATNGRELFWVLGKAPRVALVSLLSIIEAHSATFDEDTAYQALIALENCLELDDDGNLRTDILNKINETNPRPIIRQLANLSVNNPHHSDRLVKVVQTILRILQ